MAKFLVTGATGFVGNAVARNLLAYGHSVRVLSRVNADRRNLAGMEVDLVEADLMDLDSLKGVATGCDGLFHVAADYRLWVPNPNDMYKANIDGSIALIQSALASGVQRIVYTSSVATLKVSRDEQSSDETCLATESDMIGHYKRSKYLAEKAVVEQIDRGAPVVIVSPSAPIGPRDIKPTPTGKMIVDAASGRMPAYIDTGLNVVHVDDIADGHRLAYEKGEVGENYILGGKNMLLREILEVVSEIVGSKPPKVKLSPNMIKPIAYISEVISKITHKEPMVPIDGVKMAEKKMYFSHQKATQKLGYQPRQPHDAIADAIEWFKQNGYIKSR